MDLNVEQPRLGSLAEIGQLGLSAGREGPRGTQSVKPGLRQVK